MRPEIYSVEVLRKMGSIFIGIDFLHSPTNHWNSVTKSSDQVVYIFLPVQKMNKEKI